MTPADDRKAARLGRIRQAPWLWAWLGAAAVFLGAAALTTGGGALGLARAALTFGAFTALVGIGQMFVVTLGPGNVDLSMPATLTLAATLSLKLMGGSAGMILPGLAAALAVGAAAGAANWMLIRLLRIPPIVATLASSFLLQSLAIWSNRGLRIKPPPALTDFATGSVLGIPLAALAVLGVSVAAWWVLERSIWGRWLMAAGQNPRAARLAGVPVAGLSASIYVGCATLAGLAGFLLASFSGGAALNMGQDYLLASVAVVVIGGSSIAGGDSNVPGLWGASLLLFLIVSMLNSYGLSAGVRMVATGLIIISIVALGRQRPS